MARLLGLNIYHWLIIISFFLLVETGRRLLFFIGPLLVLAAELAITPVGPLKIIFTFLHLIGDPIDSLWSVLIRKEVAGRNYNLALKIAPEAAKDVASVLTAYDQWWQDDAGQRFKENLQLRKRKWRFSYEGDRIIDIINNNTSVNGDKPTLGSARAASWMGWLVAWWASIPRIGTSTPNTGTSNLEAQSNIPANREVRGYLKVDEIKRIERASERLAANRSDTLFGTWNAILIFVVILTGAYFNIALEYGDNHKPHALTVVLLLFSFLTFAVYVSGHVGNFRDHSEVMTVIRGLQGNVRQFPELSIDGLCVRDAPWAGISSWRPYKEFKTYDSTHGRSRWTLLAICFWVILSSWASAFKLSYLTMENSACCPPGAWALIGLSWVLSFLIDRGFCRLISSRRSGQILWYITLVKDTIFALGSIGLIAAAEIGLKNTLWCSASNIIPHLAEKMSIDFGKVTTRMKREDWMQWLVIPIGGLAMILVAVSFTRYGQQNDCLLFKRTSEETNAGERTIQTEESLLSAGPRDNQTDDSQHDHPQQAITRGQTRPQTAISPKARAGRDESTSSSEVCETQQRLKERERLKAEKTKPVSRKPRMMRQGHKKDGSGDGKAAKTKSISRKHTARHGEYKKKSELPKLPVVSPEYEKKGSEDGREMVANAIMPSLFTITVPKPTQDAAKGVHAAATEGQTQNEQVRELCERISSVADQLEDCRQWIARTWGAA